MSWDINSQVKLPGKNSKSPQAFAFGTPYLEIYDSLVRLDEALFRRNSVLGLLQRDAVTKRAPEKWQALEGEEVASFDVVVCFESRVFDLVVEGTPLVLDFCVKNRNHYQNYCLNMVEALDGYKMKVIVRRDFVAYRRLTFVGLVRDVDRCVSQDRFKAIGSYRIAWEQGTNPSALADGTPSEVKFDQFLMPLFHTSSRKPSLSEFDTVSVHVEAHAT